MRVSSSRTCRSSAESMEGSIRGKGGDESRADEDGQATGRSADRGSCDGCGDTGVAYHDGRDVLQSHSP